MSRPTPKERRAVRPLAPYWLADYPDPVDFLNYPRSGGGHPTADDPSYLRQASAAAKLTGPDRYLAYGKLDADTRAKRRTLGRRSAT